MTSSGLPDVGSTIGSSGWRVQAVAPASAIDAPISLRNPRRPTGSSHSGGLRRELALHEIAEGLGVGKFLEALPVLAAGCGRQAGANRGEVERLCLRS